ncbi:MAG: ATP-binding cassette domain-containing protein [Bacilli bacterium]
MISFDNVLKTYDNKTVLDRVSMSLPDNKMIAFIGPNGAGKSTLISIISRILKKDDGDIIIDDETLDNWNTSLLAKEISILRQANHLSVKITVRELVGFGRYPYSKGKLNKEDNVIIDEAINYMGINHLEDRYLNELSGGERQMAFIAMTIAQDTKYIILDEPLNNLDMNHSVKIMKILKELVEKKNKTILIVIHDINFVTNYADYIVAMKDGKILFAGDTYEIITKDILKQIYDIDIDVVSLEGKSICLYYK